MYYAVLDVGGSAIKHALMDEDANIIKQDSVATPRDGIDNFIETVGGICDKFEAEYKLEGVAISMPCAIDPKTGRVASGGALRYIFDPDINVRELIEKRTGLKVVMENDGNCAGLAEGFKGSAMDCDNYIVIVIGTGIGGTVIINKKIVYGKNLHAGEFGCMVIDDMLNDKIGKTYSDAAATQGLINNVADAKGVERSTLDGLTVFKMAEDGDEIVKEEIRKFYKYLAVGILNLQYSIDPEKILIGGAISRNENLFIEVNKILKEMKDYHHIIDIEVEPCKFLGEANLIGALYNFLNK